MRYFGRNLIIIFVFYYIIPFIPIFLKKELERLRKESSTLLAKEQAYVNELLKQQEAEKEKLGSFKLKVKWKEDGVYNDDNLKSLFSKVLYYNLKIYNFLIIFF